MKIVIFVIFLALVATAVLWRVRKADAERDLARRKALKKRQHERQRVIEPLHHEKWPVVIRPDGKPGDEQDEKLPEPTMTSIKFERAGTSH